MTRKNNQRSRGQRRDDLERKRDERSRRNALKKEREAKALYNVEDSDDYVSFKNQLTVEGFRIKEIVGDGNCLFRSFADQLEGDEAMHGKYRVEVVDYMRSHEDEFAPFLDETMTFDRYLQNLGEDGTFGGNDSIVAFARLHDLTIVIHQFNSPTFVISSNAVGTQEIHLAYHDMEHYSSLRRVNDPGDGPAVTYFNRQRTPSVANSSSSKSNLSTSKKKSRSDKQNCGSCQQLKLLSSDGACSEVTADGASTVVTADIEYDEMEDDVQKLVDLTGYQDRATVRQSLLDNDMHIDAAMSYLLQLMSFDDDSFSQSQLVDDDPLRSSQPESNGTSDHCSACTCDHDASLTHQKRTNHTKKQGLSQTVPHLSNRQRKELAKQARKKRREESKKQDVEESVGSVNQDPVVTTIRSINI